MNASIVGSFLTVLMTQTSPVEDFSWLPLVIQVLLFFGTIFMVIWRTSASAKEVQMQVTQLQPKVDCIRCRAEVEAKINAAESNTRLLEQRLEAIEKCLGEIKQSIEQLRREVRARPLGRQGTNPRFEVPNGEDDNG